VIRVVDALRSLWSRRGPVERSLSQGSAPAISALKSEILRVTRCAFCRTAVARTSFQCVVSKGLTYHTGCWERKTSQTGGMKKSA
jgi:hypothetical protein